MLSSIASSYVTYALLLLLSPYIVLLLQILLASCRTLVEWRRNGVTVFNPSWSTLKLFIESFIDHVRPRALFDAIMLDFHKLSEQGGGLYGWISPIGKPFLVVTDPGVLSQIIVQNADKLTKWHAFGCLEYFRRTELPSKVNAWRVVHRVASKFPINDKEFQSCISKLTHKYISKFASSSEGEFQDFSIHTKEFYWQVVLLMVIGEDALGHDEEPGGDLVDIKTFIELYKCGWTACIRCLGQVWAHVLSFYMYCQFFPSVHNYRTSVSSLRAQMLRRIHRHKAKSAKSLSDKKSKWCILNVIENEMCDEDQLEIAMEFLFTGASSVTTILTWLVYHIGENPDLQMEIRQELRKIIEKDSSSSFVDVGECGQCYDFPSSDWIISDQLHSVNCPILEATIKETLRMYPPIHIGRLALDDFDITTNTGKRVKVSRGTDIMSNPWFFQRNANNFENPHKFDHVRFLNRPYNVPSWHPFSLGVRSCPGMRIGMAVLKTIAANIVLKYHIEVRDSNISQNNSSGTSQFDSDMMLPCTPINTYMKFRSISSLEESSNFDDIK